MRGIFGFVLVILLVALSFSGTWAAEKKFPSKPIQVIIGFQPGDTDNTLRPFVEKMPEFLGQLALMCFGLVLLTFIARGSMLKGLMMASCGIFLGMVGIDLIAGITRFTFGVKILMDGLGVISVIMGLFGISEVFLNIEEGISRGIFKTKISRLIEPI